MKKIAARGFHEHYKVKYQDQGGAVKEERLDYLTCQCFV